MKWTDKHLEELRARGLRITVKGGGKPLQVPAKKDPGNGYGQIKRGWYPIAGRVIFFRSGWEYRYAIYLEFLLQQGKIKKWEYEPEEFEFHQIARGTRHYKPDFKVTYPNGTIVYHEVKGRMTAKARTQLDRMKKYYPRIRIHLVQKSALRELNLKMGWLHGWNMSPIERPGSTIS